MARAGASGASFHPCCTPQPQPVPMASSSKRTPIPPAHRRTDRTWFRSTSSLESWDSPWTSGIASGRPSVRNLAPASERLVDRGKRVLALEAAAVQALADNLGVAFARSEEHTSELQSRPHLV